MRIKDLLLELNVANVKSIENWIDAFLKSTDATVYRNEINHPVIQSWFKKQVRNYVLNNEEFAEPYTSAARTEWMVQAIERGEEIVRIRIPVAFEEQLAHVYDWFTWLTQQDNIEAQRILEKVPKLTIPMAIEKSEQWTEWLNKQASGIEDEQGLESVMTFKDGYRIVKLISKDCYDREGKLMQHCVASFYNARAARMGRMNPTVGSRQRVIYSLRDPENEPHVTMEIRGQEITSIQGKQNKTPIAKYRSYVRKFIIKFGLTMKWGLEKYGLIAGSDGSLHDLYNLPDGLSLLGSLDLTKISIDKLPDNLTINGNLVDFKLDSLPNNLTVKGTLYVKDTVDIPADLVSGDIVKFQQIDFELPLGPGESEHISGLGLVFTWDSYQRSLKVGSQYSAFAGRTNSIAQINNWQQAWFRKRQALQWPNKPWKKGKKFREIKWFEVFRIGGQRDMMNLTIDFIHGKDTVGNDYWGEIEWTRDGTSVGTQSGLIRLNFKAADKYNK